MQLIKTQTEGFGQTGNRQERRRGHTAAFQAPDRVDGHRRLARKIRCRSSPLPALGRDEQAQLSAMLPVSGRCRPARHDDNNTCILIHPRNRRLALSTAECSGPAGCTMASSSGESGSRSPVSWSVTEVPIRKRLHSVSASPTARLRCTDDAATGPCWSQAPAVGIDGLLAVVRLWDHAPQPVVSDLWHRAGRCHRPGLPAAERRLRRIRFAPQRCRAWPGEPLCPPARR
jgi:hypothetical protein